MFKILSDENAHNMSNIFVSFLVWTGLYMTIYSRNTSIRIKQIYPNSTRLKRQELAVKLTSILHAVYTSYGAYQCLNDYNELDIFRESDMVSYYANVAAGFFVADLILCIILLEEHGILFVIHAIAALSASLYVSMSGIGHQYFINLLLFEVSTPFLHIRSLLLEYKYDKNIIANLNNLLFLLTFGYFRLYRGIPILANLCYVLVIDKPLILSVSLFFITISISMTTLNMFWFSKILRNAVKGMMLKGY